VEFEVGQHMWLILWHIWPSTFQNWNCLCVMNKDQIRSKKVRLKVNAIEHKLVAKIKGIFHTRQTHLKSKKYLMKYNCYHHKEVVWMKPTHLNHLLEMVNKFE
jgi:hypothetical protein